MTAYHLRRAEVTYELKIRSLPTEGSANECRKRLSQSLASNAPIDDSVVNALDPEEELETCEELYQDLSTFVSDYVGNHKDNEHNRLVARLWHLYLRVGRIPVGAAADGDLEQNKQDLLSRSKDLLDSFKDWHPSINIDSDDKEIAPHADQGRQPVPALLEGSGSDSTKTFELPRTTCEGEAEQRQEEFRRLREQWQREEEKGLQQDKERREDWLRKEEEKLRNQRRQLEEKWHQEELKRREERMRQEEIWRKEELKRQVDRKIEKVPSCRPETQFDNLDQQVEERSRVNRMDSSRPRYVPVYKWGIKFDNTGPSIAAFLERVEELRRARGVTHQELYESAVDLFAGSALVWYRAAANRIRSWHHLTKELREVFQPADYDLRLHQEIFNRAQGDNEPIDLYIAAMEGLYNRLANSVPETTRLAQIYNNLHPQLQDRLALCNIDTLDQLRSMGRRAEAGRLGMNRPRQSPRTDGMLEPDLAYRDVNRRRGFSQGQVASVQSTNGRGQREVKCWNCGDQGHVFRFCRKPKRKFCFGCGKENVLKRDCPDCNPKNGRGRESEA